MDFLNKHLYVVLAIFAAMPVYASQEDAFPPESKHSPLSAMTLQIKDYPVSYRYIQGLFHKYPDRVINILFAFGAENSLQSYNGVLIIPFAWLDNLEAADAQVYDIIDNYISNRMTNLNSFFANIDWDRVSLGIVIVCLGAIAYQLRCTRIPLVQIKEQVEQLKVEMNASVQEIKSSAAYRWSEAIAEYFEPKKAIAK